MEGEQIANASKLTYRRLSEVSLYLVRSINDHGLALESHR